jgi:hypothetical protein
LFPLAVLDPTVHHWGRKVYVYDGPKRQSKQAKQASVRRTVIEASHFSEPAGPRQLDINLGLSGQNRLL